MNKSIFLIAIGFLIVASGCQQKFKKSEDGSEYKVITNSKGTVAVPGNFLELSVVVKYKDSTLFSSIENGSPNFVPFDTTMLPVFFRTVHEGDSLVIREMTDSIMKSGQGLPWMEKGNYIVQQIKVVKVITTKEQADSISKTYAPVVRANNYKKGIENIEKDLVKEANQLKIDDQLIKDYLAKNNITATKTKWGTYVSITTPGTGPKITQNDVAVINYTGKTFKDSTFDSNTDKNFNHVEPLYVDMGIFRVIPGWIDGLQNMQKGSKGKLIIPSTLGYGITGRMPKIGPNENLVFDMEVTDVISQEAYQQKMEEQNAMMQMLQQQMQQQQQQQQPNK